MNFKRIATALVLSIVSVTGILTTGVTRKLRDGGAPVPPPPWRSFMKV